MSEWEHVHEHVTPDGDRTDNTERMRVPGGWLYRVVLWQALLDDERTAMSVVFVPDPERG